MNCPRCSRPLERRMSQGLAAYVCQTHGAWQDWDTIHALIRKARAEATDSAELAIIEGFLWGKML